MGKPHHHLDTASTEHSRNRLRFATRLVQAFCFSGILIALSLSIGVAGYHYIAGFGWIDSLLNASMILTGMGPVGNLTSDAAKIFASVYALFSGVVFITSTGILLSPMFHRILHRFHLDERDLR